MAKATAKTAKRTFKKKKSLGGGRQTFKPWKEYSEGDTLVGQFVGTHEDNYGNTCWKMKIVDAQLADKKFAKSIIDKTIVMNSAGQLDKAMEKVEEGTFLEVVYNGTSEIEKGKYKGKEAHLHEVTEVEMDDDDSDEDEELDEDEETDDEDDSEDEDDDSDDDDDEDYDL